MEKLFSKIKQCKSEKEVRELIDKALEEANENSKSGLTLCFSDESKAQRYHRGFINLKNRIRYTKQALESYGMGTTDYFYEFAINVWKSEVIKSKADFICYLQMYINYYFGLPKYKTDQRYDFFYMKAWNETTTDDELFERLEKNQIGDLRGLGIAECSERSAVAQNLLSLFGFDSYMSFGEIKRNGKQEGHTFLVVKGSKDYFLLDYSIPVRVTRENGSTYFIPYQAEIPADKLNDFLENTLILDLDDYENVITREGVKKLPLEGKRRYVISDKPIDLSEPSMGL